MKPLSELTAEDIKDIKVVCFDVDGVTLKRGTQIIDKGNEQIMRTVPLENNILQKLLKLKKYFHITINSGRSGFYLTKVFGDILWGNASLISENGIFVLYKGKFYQNFIFTPYELEVLQNVTNKLKVLATNDKRADGFEYKMFLLVLHCNKEIPEVPEIVKGEDKKDEFYCWWNGEAYDICPKRFNKGVGLRKLCELLGYTTENAIAIGNGINDKDMTDIAKIGITTDKEHLQANYFIDGEHLGGEYLMDKLLELKEK
jgi:hydroxymethylpyrimidine pyrophosphatase-like HAD family hydrolase